jgi:hypothetical protein
MGSAIAVLAATSVWEYVFTYGLFLVVFGAFTALSYWGYRRRRQGIDAGSTVVSPGHQSDLHRNELGP